MISVTSWHTMLRLCQIYCAEEFTQASLMSEARCGALWLLLCHRLLLTLCASHHLLRQSYGIAAATVPLFGS